jgi:hypothetical protein
MVIDKISSVISKYGNMIEPTAQRSLAFDILTCLEEEGHLNSEGSKEVTHWNKMLEDQQPEDTLTSVFEGQKRRDPKFAAEQDTLLEDLKSRKENVQAKQKEKIAAQVAVGTKVKEQAKKDLASFTEESKK